MWPAGARPQDENAFARYDSSLVPELEKAAAADRAEGHVLTPVIMELVHEDGTLEYKVMDGMRCDHMCSACRADIDQMSSEFGTGAIGVFSESMGGEMERLRKALRELAQTIQLALPAGQRRDLPAATEVAGELEDGKSK